MEPTSVLPTEPSEGSDLDPDLAVGSMVGEYRVEGKLGQGGFGAVFKALHPLIGKQVAIKVLSTKFSADREMVSRFQAEARAVNQIRHQNIIDIFSFGQLEDRRHYYVMELIEGEPLDRRIARGRMSLAESLPILRAVARALDAAHAKGIAHRDLKAENIFIGIDPDGNPFPKLLDFGIAKLMGSEEGIAHKTQTGAPMGTPYYMSPEQTRGRNVDHRTDLYAFGVLVYVMLTQKFPLDGDDYVTILMRQVADEPLPASSHVPDIPERVDHTIAWLMRKDPAERPPDLITAVRALEQAGGLQAGASSAQISSPAIVIPSHVTTRPSQFATGAGATVASTAVTTVATTHVERSPASSKGLVMAIAAIVAVAAVIAVVVMSKRTSGDGAPGSGSGSVAVATVDAAVVPPPIDAAVAAVGIDAPPATPRMVTITLAGAPANTEVKIGGELFGTAPKVQVPFGDREVVLVLTAENHAPLSLPITPDKDQKHMVKLKSRGGTAPPRPGSGSASAGGSASGSGNPTDDIMNFPPPKPKKDQ